MWYLEGDRPKQGRKNSWRQSDRGAVLRVTARAAAPSQERTHRAIALVILLVALAGLGVAAVLGFRQLGAWLFSRNPRFSLHASRMDLQSTGRLQPAHLRDYAGLAEGMNVFALDLAAVRAKLLGVPVIKSASVERVLPDGLRVRVSERTPVARLLGPGGFQFVVDRDGVVLGPSSRAPTLPLLEGLQEPGLSPGTQIRAGSFQDALEAIEYCETSGLIRRFRLVRLRVDQEELLDVRLETGGRVLLGRTNLRWRLDQLARIVEKAAAARKVVLSADLTVDENFPVILADR